MNWYYEVERELARIEGSIRLLEQTRLPYEDADQRSRVLARETARRQGDGRAEQNAVAPHRRNPRAPRTILICSRRPLAFAMRADRTIRAT